ncbi:hypothetical protein [Roseateles albus]|uniref:Uncharacterized protein n=1 Tax=Roseateles albus TaxID=2987525 RepID=A0ABT5KBV9_9BURK|nr:hypothetical protein [Roseateles albus]MDC8771368.1 hypothetical protein [Roseateles albus]
MDALAPSKFEGRAAYVANLRQALLQACAANARDLYCFDENLVDWPWSDADVLAALTTWAKPHRRLHLLAAEYEDLRQRHPRFVRWRGNWGHCVQALAYTPEAFAAAGSCGGVQSFFTCVGTAQALSLSLFDKRLWRSSISTEAEDSLQKSQWFDALAQRSSESFAVTTLGL